MDRLRQLSKMFNTNGIKDITSNYEYDGSGNFNKKKANVVQSLTNKTSTETTDIFTTNTGKEPVQFYQKIKNNGVTIDYAYGCDNKKTDVTVDTKHTFTKRLMRHIV